MRLRNLFAAIVLLAAIATSFGGRVSAQTSSAPTSAPTASCYAYYNNRPLSGYSLGHVYSASAIPAELLAKYFVPVSACGTPNPSVTPECGNGYVVTSSPPVNLFVRALTELLGLYIAPAVQQCGTGGTAVALTPSPSPSPIASATPIPSATPFGMTPAPTSTPTIAPSATPVPTASPSPTLPPTPSPTPYVNTFEGNTLGSSPSEFSVSSAASWTIAASAQTNTLTHELTDVTGVLNDLFWLNSFETQSVEEQFSFVPVSSSAAGVSAIVYSSDGQYFTLNLITGDVNYYSANGGTPTYLGNSGGHLSSMNPQNYYCASIFFTASGTYSIASKVWQCNHAEPEYSASVVTSAYSFPSFTAGVRNNSGQVVSIDDLGIAPNGAVLTPIYAGSTAIPASPTPTPTASPAPTASPTATPTSTPTPVPTATPVTLQGVTTALNPSAYYRLNDTSGTVAIDSIGHSNGTYNGSTYALNQAAITPGDATGVLFSGNSSGNVDTNLALTDPAIEGTSFSISAWVKFSSPLVNGMRVVANAHTDSSTNQYGFQLRLVGTTMEFDLHNSAGNSASVANSTTIIAGTLYHLVAVADGTNALTQLYVNGVAASTSGGYGTPSAANFSVAIGDDPAYSGDGTNGTISEVSFFSRALTQANVTAIYQAGTGTSPTAAPTSTPTVSPTSTPTPAPTATPAALVYSNATPFPAGSTPVAFTFPSSSTVTVEAGYNCVTNSAGGTIIAALSSWYFEGGTCDGGQNPTGATGAHMYDVANAVQAVPANSLIGGWLMVAARIDGTNVTYYVCNQTCVATSTSDTGTLANNTGGLIGGSSATQRVNSGDIGDILIYNTARTVAQIQADANTITNAGDPYNRPTPSPSPTAVGATPTPTPTAMPTTACNGDPGVIPTMPNDIFCNAIPSSPNIASNSAAMVTAYAQGPSNSASPVPEFLQSYDAGCCDGLMYQAGATNFVNAPQYATRAAIFWAQSTDPLYTIVYRNPQSSTLADYGEEEVNETINIPAGAVPQSGGCSSCGEGHIAIIDPTGTYEYDFNESVIVNGSNGNPGTITVQEAVKTPLASGTGWGCGHPYNNTPNCKGGSVTNSARLITRGLLDGKELLNGFIGHALSITISCTNKMKVAPGIGTGSDSPCTQNQTPSVCGGSGQPTCTYPQSMYAAQRFFIDACDGTHSGGITYPNICSASQRAATVASWTGVTVPGRTALTAMANYGMYSTDETGSNADDFYIEAIDPHSYKTTNASEAITNWWPQVGTTFGLSAYPNGGQTNFGFDLKLRNVPTNPNGPPGSTGLWSWVEFCSSSGC